MKSIIMKYIPLDGEPKQQTCLLKRENMLNNLRMQEYQARNLSLEVKNALVKIYQIHARRNSFPATEPPTTKLERKTVAFASYLLAFLMRSALFMPPAINEVPLSKLVIGHVLKASLKT